MDVSRTTLNRAGTTVAYVTLGAVGTAAMALAVLVATQPLQTAIYDALSLQIGPSEATEAAILTHFLASGVIAIGALALLGDYFDERLANRAAFGRSIAAMAVLVGVFLVASLAGLASFLTALVILAVALVGVPVVLRYREGIRSGGVPAFVGGIPVLVLMLLAAGFGLGWGWGYVVVAQEVPASSVNGSAATFDDAPNVRDDLFAPGICEEDGAGRRVCHLSLRGYEHETAAVRFLASHGVRCPYRNAPDGGRGGSFVARHDGTYYRVTCSPHGD